MDMQAIQAFVSTTLVELAIKVLAAIAFWIIGRWLIGAVVNVMQAALNRNQVDATLTKYLGSIVAIALNIALVLGILGYFGIQTTSFAAMLAGAGVAIGAAWSGMLGNFAAGAFMLVLRPFKVGDFVSVAGSVNLHPDGRKRFIAGFERRLDQEVTHPLFGYRLSYRRLLELQCRLFGRHLLGELPEYPNFTTR